MGDTSGWYENDISGPYLDDCAYVMENDVTRSSVVEVSENNDRAKSSNKITTVAVYHGRGLWP